MEATVPTESRQQVLDLADGRIPGTAKLTRQILSMGAATALTLRSAEDRFAAVQALTDNSVVTLPLAADSAGCEIRVQNVGAATAAKVSISPQAADKIVGTVGAVQSGGVANKDWINAKGTTKQGDFTVLMSDGGTTWWIVGGVGVWASEA
jgi:hypothetical protein